MSIAYNNFPPGTKYIFAAGRGVSCAEASEKLPPCLKGEFEIDKLIIMYIYIYIHIMKQHIP